jgi:hypothetical protein
MAMESFVSIAAKPSCRASKGSAKGSATTSGKEQIAIDAEAMATPFACGGVGKLHRAGLRRLHDSRRDPKWRQQAMEERLMEAAILQLRLAVTCQAQTLIDIVKISRQH